MPGTFTNLVGTDLKLTRKSNTNALPTDEPSYDEDDKITITDIGRRWSRNGDIFWQATRTCKRLDPGFYKFDNRPGIGMCLIQATVSTDALIRLPDTATEAVLAEFSTFWGLRERFTSRGFLHKRGILLWGGPGCLAADSMIQYRAFNNGRQTHMKNVMIERLYQLFHRTTGPGKGRYQLLPLDTEIRIASVDEQGHILSNVVQNVIQSGVKPVFRLRTVGGLEIVATEDHKFLSRGDYIRLGSLTVGDHVEVHINTPVNTSAGMGVQTGRKFCYVKHHPVARTKTVAGNYTYKVLPNSRVVVEAAMNSLSREKFLDRLNAGEIEGLTFLDRDQDVHHIDEDCTNDHPGNLQVLSHSEHARLHGMDQDLFLVTSSDEIASIEFVGERETYDIQMAAPYHNFVANKFVVHNSGKTASLMLMAEDIIEQHGGIVCDIDHPALAANCLSMIRKIEPERRIVAFLEDLDALVDRHGENAYLSLLDGETQVNGIVYVATTNYPERLDKRFVDRPSRFDTVRWIGMPSAEARRVYLRTKEPTLCGNELDQWVAATHGFSVAHLRELVILVKCFDQSLKDAIERLDSMRMRAPNSGNSPDRPQFGIVGPDDD